MANVASPASRPRLTANKEFSYAFKTPRDSPSASNSIPNTRPDYFTTTSAGSRKRSRADSTSRSMSTYTATEIHTPIWSCSARNTDEEDSFGGGLSTESLVHDRYRLRDGFDTPGLLANTDLYNPYSPADVDYNARRSLRDHSPQLRSTEPTFGPLARERNGYARTYPSSNNGVSASPSWSKLALALPLLPLTLAGKMFSFGTTVLKGFYAGGGQGYEIDSTRRWEPDLTTPVPGSWYESPTGNRHDDDDDAAFEGDFEQDNTPTTTTTAGGARPPPSKRRLTDKDSWVVVDIPADISTPVPLSPKRKTSVHSASRIAARPRASSRRSHLAIPRRQSYSASNAVMSVGSPLASPQLQQRQQQSHTTEYMPRTSGVATPKRHSPSNSMTFPSPDAERFAKRQAKQERAADKTMNSMSRQLEELIRQGQAALGTKFTIEDNQCLDAEEDEGFVDEC